MSPLDKLVETCLSDDSIPRVTACHVPTNPALLLRVPTEEGNLLLLVVYDPQRPRDVREAEEESTVILHKSANDTVFVDEGNVAVLSRPILLIVLDMLGDASVEEGLCIFFGVRERGVGGQPVDLGQRELAWRIHEMLPDRLRGVVVSEAHCHILGVVRAPPRPTRVDCNPVGVSVQAGPRFKVTRHEAEPCHGRAREQYPVFLGYLCFPRPPYVADKDVSVCEVKDVDDVFEVPTVVIPLVSDVVEGFPADVDTVCVQGCVEEGLRCGDVVHD